MSHSVASLSSKELSLEPILLIKKQEIVKKKTVFTFTNTFQKLSHKKIEKSIYILEKNPIFSVDHSGHLVKGFRKRLWDAYRMSK